jgi:hypothetical protein
MSTLSEHFKKSFPEDPDFYLHSIPHVVEAGRWKLLEQILTDFEFIETKCIAGLFGLLQDYELAMKAHHSDAVAQIQRALSLAMPGLAERPELALQTIYNRLIWFERVEPPLQVSLAAARSFLDRRQLWISAEAPLPGSDTQGTTSVLFDIVSSIQSISPASTSIGIASIDGNVEVRSLPDGKLLSSRSLNASRIAAITLLNDPVHVVEPARIAYVDLDGVIRSDEGCASIAGRGGDGLLAYHPTQGIIAVRSDNALVAWRADRDEAEVIAADIPAPLAVLKISPDGGSVLYVAGFRNQKIGLATRTGEKWVTKLLPYAGPPLVDVDLDFGASYVLLAGMNRRLCILDTQTYEPRAELFYEARGDMVLRGAPIRCAFGLGASAGWAFIATQKGHIACWNWERDQMHRLEDYQSVNQLSSLVHFHTLGSTGELLYTTETRARTISRGSHYRRAVGHEGAVSSCCFTALRQVVSASEVDQAVRWFTAKGLKPLAQQVRDHWEPAVLGRNEESEGVIVGTRAGWVWSQPPSGEVPEKEIFIAFAEPVVSLFSAGDGCVLAAGQSGRVLRINLLTDEIDRLWHSTGTQKQRKILPAVRHGLYWSLYESDAVGGKKLVLSLVSGINEEQVVLTSDEQIYDVAVSRDGATVGTCGESVQLLRQVGGKWSVVYQRNTPAERVAFLGSREDLIAVALREEAWLEIWDTSPGLPTVAAIELGAKLSCISTLDDWIVAGFRSGNLMTACLRRGPSV